MPARGHSTQKHRAFSTYGGVTGQRRTDMHEMAMTQSVVDAVCEHAAGRRVHSVKVEIGALCAVVPDSMQFCFELATEGTVADGAASTSTCSPARPAAAAVGKSSNCTT